jgi:DNA repair protein RadC
VNCILQKNPNARNIGETPDIEITKKLIGSGKMIGIELFDHVIIGVKITFT